MTSRDLLIERITFHLAQQRDRLPKPGKRENGWGPTIDEFRPVADLIVTALQGEGFTVERKAPAAGHSTP